MPNDDMKPEDREALEDGRKMKWVKDHWQVLAILLAVMGGSDAKRAALGALGIPTDQQVMVQAGPTQLERLATVEERVQGLVKKADVMDEKLDRLLSRPLYRPEDRAVSHLLEGTSQTAQVQR